MSRNIALMPWYGFLRNLSFWQATWFLFFQSELSAAEAILLYMVYDIATTALEIPSGWMSDRLGRRITLIAAAIAGAAGTAVLAFGHGFEVFIAAQILLGVHAAFVSGTDSALLYESLKAEGRQAEIEAQEVKHWRFTFAALALSALIGGGLALYSMRLPFIISAIALTLLICASLAFTEPPRDQTTPARDVLKLGTLRPAFRNPVLLWLFALGVLMYGYSHVPFVFGQPFIEAALAGSGFAAEAPLASGTVSSIMMLVSLAVSLIAPKLRQRLGLGSLLLLAFGLQVALSGLLAVTNAPIAIALLFLRMVPSSLSGPFMLARIQPLLQGETRATYLSLRSFFGRLLFATTLYFAAGSASDVGAMSFDQISAILMWYCGAGALAWAILFLTLRRVPLDPVDDLVDG